MQQKNVSTTIDHPHDLTQAAFDCGKPDHLHLSERAYQLLVTDFARLRNRTPSDRERQAAFELLTAFRAKGGDEAEIATVICRPVTGLDFHRFVCTRIFPHGEPAYITVEEIDEHHLSRMDREEFERHRADLDELNSYVCDACGGLVTVGLHACPDDLELLDR